MDVLEPATEARKRAEEQWRRRRNLWIFAGLILLGLLGLGLWWLLIGRWWVVVDDAYVQGNIYPVTARVSGTIASIPAYDTMSVRRGQILVTLGAARALRQLRQAEAVADQARQNALALEQDIAASNAKELALAAQLASAKQNSWRLQAAARAGAAQDLNAVLARNAVNRLRAELAAEAAHSKSLAARLGPDGVDHNPALRAAEESLALAHLNWSRHVIHAPVTGILARQSVQPGQWVEPGQHLFSIVPLKQIWVDANIKETRLAKVRPGAEVTLYAAAYGNSVTYHGWVAGIGGGSGAIFAVLPPENASGNWIKFTQRVPVRIALDPTDLRRHPLRPGLTMTAQIAVDGPRHKGPVPAWFIRETVQQPIAAVISTPARS
jgi:membrane fusion protein (multidrug efflux system)